MLDELVNALKRIRQCMEDHAAALETNEALTRMALIDPLLRVLGWDTSDPRLVVPEYAAGSGRVDYALMKKESNQPLVFLEAKKLGMNEPDDKITNQMLTYANSQAVPFAGISDGDRWQVYEVFKQVPLMDRRILDVSTAKDELSHCALKLLVLWRSNLATNMPVETGEPIAWKPVEAISANETGQKRNSAERQEAKPGAKRISLPDLATGKNDPRPAFIHFPNGQSASIRYWYEILTQTVEWLVQYGSHPPVPFRVRLKQNSRIYIANTQPMHTTMKFIRAYQCKGKEIYVERNISASQAKDRAIKLLEVCREDPQKIWLEMPRLDLTASSSAKVAIPPAFPFHSQENASRQNQEGSIPHTPPVQHEYGHPLPGEGWVSLTKYEVRLGDSPPSAILFPNQQQVTISRWKQLLTSTVEWLLRATEFQLPADPQNSTKFFVNTEPKSPRGIFYKHPHIFKHKGMNIYVNTWKDCKNLKRHTIEVLEAGAVDPRDVYVKR